MYVCMRIITLHMVHTSDYYCGTVMREHIHFTLMSPLTRKLGVELSTRLSKAAGKFTCLYVTCERVCMCVIYCERLLSNHGLYENVIFFCRSWQILEFEPCPVTFIKIVGTTNTANEVFHCVHFECPASGYSSSHDTLKYPLF